MSEPDFLATSRVAIIGLGLIGGSLALALRDRCRSLLGCDLDPAALELAQEQDLFTKVSPHPADILPAADVVILATPLKTILNLIEQLPDLHPGSCIVLDLGSTKVAVVEALKRLPARFDPLGGHPMCGKEKTGFEHADAGLFQDAAFAFTSLERTSSKARAFAEQLAAAIGSHPQWVDPQTHDRWVSATSHLPYLVASALAGSTPAQAKPLVGPGFRSTTRVAATPARLMLDVLETNRENILDCLDTFVEKIEYYKNLLASGEYKILESALEDSAIQQQQLVAPPGKKES